MPICYECQTDTGGSAFCQTCNSSTIDLEDTEYICGACDLIIKLGSKNDWEDPENIGICKKCNDLNNEFEDSE